MTNLFPKTSRLALTLLILGSFLALSPSTLAASSESCQIDEKLDNLLSAKDNLELSEEEKVAQEFTARQNLLSTIISCSLSESKDIKEKISSLPNLTETEASIQKSYLSDLDSFISYYESQNKIFEKISEDQDKVRQLAQEILEWRQKEYNPKIKNIVDFSFIFKQREIISTAKNRLDKIKTSLSSLLSISSPQVNRLIKSAETHINQSVSLNNSAHNLHLEKYQESSALESSTSTPKASSPLFKAAIPAPNSILSEISTSTATSTSETVPPLTEPTSRDLVRQSLQEIKSAYDDFFEVSKAVKILLGF